MSEATDPAAPGTLRRGRLHPHDVAIDVVADPEGSESCVTIR